MSRQEEHPFGSTETGYSTNRRQFVKDIADTRWDWLRRPAGLSIVIALSFVVLFVAPVMVWFANDPIGLVPLAFAASVYLTWPQANALIWFVFAQILLMPSLTMAVGIHRRKVQL